MKAIWFQKKESNLIYESVMPLITTQLNIGITINSEILS